MIRAVFFDLGGVVYLPKTKTITRWAQRLGLTTQQLIGATYSGNDPLAGIGRMTEDDWWDHVRGRLECTGDDFIALVTDFCTREPDQGTVELLRRTRTRARTAYLSNAWSGERARLTNLGLADLVDAIVISAEVGALKPDEQIYRIALDLLGVEPDESVLIDDTLDNVEAAAELGMHGILFHSADQAANELTRLLPLTQAPKP